MGAVCPYDLATANSNIMFQIEKGIMQKCVDSLDAEGLAFTGVLFAGLMILPDQRVKVLEFNCRFGDPETQSILPLLKTDLYDVFEACTRKELAKLNVQWLTNSMYTCGIVLADADYPDCVNRGQLMSNLPAPTRAAQYSNPQESSVFVIHAGTKLKEIPSTEKKETLVNQREIVSDGGRILTVIGCSSKGMQRARDYATETISGIIIEKARFRRDIGQRMIDRQAGRLELGEPKQPFQKKETQEQLNPVQQGPAPGHSEGTPQELDSDQPIKEKTFGQMVAAQASLEAAKSQEAKSQEQPMQEDPLPGPSTDVTQEQDRGLTYKDCGVDIEKGNKFVESIKAAAKQSHRDGVMSQIGSFGAFFDLKKAVPHINDPLLVSGTDGVGTKLKLAVDCQYYDSIGIDLVAMCVNDILVHGAQPLFFLDYYACSQLNIDTGSSVITGIVKGCELAKCALIGGETAEMPGLYNADDFDLAGFAVGVVERSLALPRLNEMKAGDHLIGLASSGLHSNGFSLVRRLIETNVLDIGQLAPFRAGHAKPLAHWLLTPTRIYVRQLSKLLERRLIKGMAHITGGGIVENLPRSLPENLTARLDARTWPISPEFAWVRELAGSQPEDLLQTFNCGLGMILIVDPTNVNETLKLLANTENEPNPATAYQIGKLETRESRTQTQCIIENISETFDLSRKQLNLHQIVSQSVTTQSLSAPPKQRTFTKLGNLNEQKPGSTRDDLAAELAASDLPEPLKPPTRRYKCLIEAKRRPRLTGKELEEDYLSGGMPEDPAQYLAEHFRRNYLNPDAIFECNEQCSQRINNSLQTPKRVAILISGTGTNAQAIIEYERELGVRSPYRVVLVLTNKADAPGLKHPRKFHIPVAFIDNKKFPSRVDFDMELDSKLREHKIDIVCLAGFMRILSKEFVDIWSGKVINIHPSLLPAFKGMHAYRQALEYGVRLTGCTVHFVSAGVDEGAIISQEAIEVLPTDTEGSLTERGKRLENYVFPRALTMVAGGRAHYDHKRNRSIIHLE